LPIRPIQIEMGGYPAQPDAAMSSIFTKPISAKSLTGEGPVAGLDLEAGSVAAAQVKSNGSLTVEAAAVQPLPPDAFRDGEVADPEAVTAAVRSLYAAHKLSRRVRLGIANQRVVVRTLRLPAIDDPAELESAVRFTAQEQIAMPLDQAMIEHRVVGGVAASGDAPPQIDVMVVAARRDMIATSLKPLRDAGLEPVGVDLSAFGMIRALADAAGPEIGESDAIDQSSRGAILYCNVGDVTNLAVAKGRSCLFTRISPIGLEDIVGNLATQTGLSLEHARMWIDHVGLAQPIEAIEGDPGAVAQTRSALETGATALLDELRLSLDFYGAQEGAIPVDKILLCGPGSAIPGLTEHMQNALGLAIAAGRPSPLAGYDAPTAARLTLPFGLALDR
jgi:type IV pilus assembly protein PilM